MEGISQVTDGSTAEQLLPLAPRKRKAGHAKAGMASAISLAALAMFAPKPADANQVTIQIQGTVASGSDNNSDGSNGVFGPKGSLAGKSFTLTFTFDDTKGTETYSGGVPISIASTTGNPTAGTATLAIEGAAVSIGTRYPSNTYSSGSRSVSPSLEASSVNFEVGASGEELGESVQMEVATPDGDWMQMTTNPDWRSGLTYAAPSDATAWSFTYSESATISASGTLQPTSITISGIGLLGSNQQKTLGQQNVASCTSCTGDDTTPAKSASTGSQTPVQSPSAGIPVASLTSATPSTAAPINISSGNMYETVADYVSGGANQLTFIRSYNSLGNGSPTFATTLGSNWRNNYDRYINSTAAVVLNGGTFTASTPVYAERADGQILTFTPNGSGGFTSDTDTDYTLTKSGSTWTLTDPDDDVETYTDLGTGEAILETITQRNGYELTLAYNGSNQLTTVTDSYSRELSLTYTAGGLIDTVTAPGGLVLTYGYNASGVHGAADDQLASVSYNTSPVTSQTYNYGMSTEPFALTSITDENGNTAAAWTYDSAGRALSSERFSTATNAIEQTSISYNNTTGATVTNALGLEDTYTYTVLQGVPKVSEVDRAAATGIPAASRTFGYDSNGFQNCATRWMATAATCSTVTTGDATQVTNNSHGQPTQIVEAAGSSIQRTTNITYDSTFVHLPSVITEPTRTITNVYDGNGATCSTNGNTGDLCSSTVADTLTSLPSRTAAFTWNATGEPLTEQGPVPNGSAVNQLATMTYDGAGNLSTIVATVNQSAGSNITTNFTSYNADGRLLSATDPNGLVTNLTYDVRGNLLTRAEGTSLAGFEVTTLTRDATETITQITKPDSSVLTLGRDNAHRLTSITDSLNEQIKYTLDAAGDRTAVNVYDSSSNLNRTHTYAYDALSRMTSDTDAYSNTTTYTYDNNSNRLSVTDPLGDRAAKTYDALNRVSTVTDPLNGVTTIAYSPDTLNLVSQVVSPRGVTTSYIRDGFGDVTETQSPDTGPTTRTFDLAGNVATSEDANGNTTTYTYDALDRVKTATYQDGTVSNYYYDSQTNSIGRLKQISDPTPAGQSTNTTYFGYDIHGRVTWKQSQLNGQNYYATYNGTTGQLTSETYPSGMVIGYKYDAAGQMNEVDINGSWFVHGVTHQPFGPVSGWTWGVGTNTSYARPSDLDGRLTSYPFLADTRTLSYDAASRVTQVADSTTTQSFGYDAKNQITSYTGPFGNGNQTLTYDADGNRTGITTAAGTETDAIDASSNVLQSRTLGSTVTNYTADGAGNITAAGGTAYTYDVRNRQATVTSGGQTINSFYNGLGERIEKYGAPSGLWREIFAPAGKELTSARELGSYVWNGSTNAPLQETIYIDGTLPVGVNASGGTGAEPWNTLRAYADQQGAIRRLADQNLNLFGTWDSDAFGNGAANYNPAGNGAVYLDTRFPGQSSNDEDGTFWNTTRNYSPAIGKYLQSDTIGLSGGINTYAYVGSNPGNLVDPTGRDATFPVSGPYSTPVYIGGNGPLPSSLPSTSSQLISQAFESNAQSALNQNIENISEDVGEMSDVAGWLGVSGGGTIPRIGFFAGCLGTYAKAQTCASSPSAQCVVSTLNSAAATAVPAVSSAETLWSILQSGYNSSSSSPDLSQQYPQPTQPPLIWRLFSPPLEHQ
jgi:RHS repeat-associated protein